MGHDDGHPVGQRSTPANSLECTVCQVTALHLWKAGAAFDPQHDFRYRSVLALQSTGACHVDCHAERLCDEIASLAMLGCAPSAQPDARFDHRRVPSSTLVSSERPAIYGPSIRNLAHLHALL